MDKVNVIAPVETNCRRNPPKTVNTPGCSASCPLHIAVGKQNVISGKTRGRVGPNYQLERICFINTTGEIAYSVIGHDQPVTKNFIPYQPAARISGIDIAPESRYHRRSSWETVGTELAHTIVERDVTVVIDEHATVNRAKQREVETECNRPYKTVVIAGQRCPAVCIGFAGVSGTAERFKATGQPDCICRISYFPVATLFAH